MPDINSGNKVVKAFAERVAINTTVQGSSADVIKIAMINLNRELGDDGWIIIQVHDELLLEVRENSMEAVKKLVVDKMEGAMKLNTPLKVDIGVGKNWLEAHNQ